MTEVERKRYDITGEIPDFSGMLALIAEDIDINLRIFIAMLKLFGLEADGATNGKEAVEMFYQKEGKYDIILMDMKMPEMDGVEAAIKIRESGIEGAKDIPIITLTGSPFMDDRNMCLKAGMNEFITKPISTKEMLELMKKYLAPQE